jgi:hypothetical protein
MSYLQSSPQQFLSMYITGRVVSDPTDTMETSLLIQAGQANYDGNRAGDFSGISIDPNDSSFWAANEFTNTESTNWGTWIAGFVPNGAPITVTGLTVNPNPAAEGNPINLTGAFNDPTANQTHTVVVSWGDGTANTTVNLPTGMSSFAIPSHTYEEESPAGAPYAIIVTVTNGDGFSGLGTTSSAVTDAPLTMTSTAMSGRQNMLFSGIVGTFTDADPHGTPTDYSATITWGDGHTSPGTVTGNGTGVLTVTGSNTYAATGSFTVTIQVTDAGGSTASATSTMQIAPPAPPAIFATGADAGGGPQVNVYDNSGDLKFAFMAYDAQFLGGVRVAVADVNGDGVPDIITAPGPGGGPDIRIFDGQSGAMIGEFLAYDYHFNTGVYVAAADFNGDGKADIVTAPDQGGGPDIRIFNGASAATGGPPPIIGEFLAYDFQFLGGVRIAVGNVTGTGGPDIITAPGPGGGPDIRVFQGTTGALIQEFLAYDYHFDTGVFVAAGDVNGDGKADIVTAPDQGGGPDVRVFDGGTDTLIQEFLAYTVGFEGGVRVAVTDVNGDGKADIITGAGPSGGPAVGVFSGLSSTTLDSFYAYDPSFTGGVFVGAQ